MNKNDMKTKDKVLKAAAKQFAINGFDGTTTRAIAQEANANLSAIPIYFKTKENLYKEALEHTISLFSKKSEVFEKEMKNAEKRGLINQDNAWDYIVEYVGNLIEWIFDSDFFYERLLLNRELLDPTDTFTSISKSIINLYLRFEMLFLIYTGSDDIKWAKHFSYMMIQALFAYGNYPAFMKRVTERDMKQPSVVSELKIDVKRDALTSIKAVLRSRRIDG